jgi:WS/DGAT/MGAT family acyltransferase
MQKLSFQDASFLRGEIPERPQHIGALLLFTRPKGAGEHYMRQLAAVLPEQLLATHPGFQRRLKDPEDIRNPRWVEANDLDRGYHFRHYALPQPGQMQDLLHMVSLAHQPMLDRSRPLWELHLIEGLPHNQFAVYGRVHHALIDGLSGMGVMNRLLHPRPRPLTELASPGASPRPQKKDPGKARQSWLRQWENNVDLLRDQLRAVPEVISQFRRMGFNREEDAESPPLLFTAPRSILNQQGGPDRCLLTLNLPLQSLADIGRSAGGTVNDALIAVFGGALRSYLLQQKALPRAPLVTVLPVGVKVKGQRGNSLSMTTCPMGTNVSDPVQRLKKIVKVTKKAKSDMSKMSKTALLDMLSLVMMPMMVLNLTHTASKVRPAVNVVVSNVPGPRKTLYLADAPMQAMYPISLLPDAMALNLTAISYRKQVCIGLIACPTGLSGIESLATLLREAHDELLAAL